MDYPVRYCPNCSSAYPEGAEFVYVPQADEYVCRDCAHDLRGIDR